MFSMKLLFLLFCMWLLPFYALSKMDQGAMLGVHGYRLVRTVDNADFDYHKLDFYFTNKVALDGLGQSAVTIFEPIDGYYTLHFFLGDLRAEEILTPDRELELAYVPAPLSEQNMLVLKVMDSRVFTDGFLVPNGGKGIPLSESLFRVRTKGLPVKRKFNLDELNLRNLYDRSLRADVGVVYLTENLFWPEAEAVKGLEVRYNLVKKVVNADFNYTLLDNAERYDEELKKKRLLADYEPNESEHKKQGRCLLGMLEPVAGEFIYYQFIADVVVGDLFFPEHDEDRDSFADKMEIFFAPDDYVVPLVVVRNVLILKTDSAGLIMDAYGSPVDLIQLPASGNLLRLGRQGVRLRDGLSLKELGLTDEQVYGLSPDEGKISLFPK